MEAKLTFEEVLGAFEAASRLIDAEFTDPVTAVKVGQAHRTLAPLYEDIGNRRNALVKQHAARDVAGEIIYIDEEKTVVKMTPELVEHLNAFLASEIDVTLPALDSEKLGVGAGLRLADIYGLRELLSPLPAHETKITRADVDSVVKAIGGLMGQAFADSKTAAKLAQTRGELLPSWEVYNTRCREIAMEHATRDDAGEIVYMDAETKEFAVTPPAAAAIEEYGKEEITFQLVEMEAGEFVLANGKGISPRRLYGLMPILKV